MTRMQRLFAKGVRAAAAFEANKAGIAAVEFAFILPIMLAIYLGIVELARGLSASRKIDLIAHAMSDLTGQQLTGGGTATAANTCSVGGGQAAICDSTMTQIFAAAVALLAPLDPTSLQITISEVNIQLISGVYKASVNWTVSYNGGTLRSGQGCTLNTYLSASDNPPITPTSMPTSFTNANNIPGLTPTLGPVIVADVSYTYNLNTFNLPNVNLQSTWGPIGSITMNRTNYSPVRNTYTNTNPSPVLFNHIQDLTTSATNGVNCLGYLTPPLN